MTKQELRNIFAGGHLGDSLDLKRRFEKIADYLYDSVPKFKGTDTAENINKITEPGNLDVYIISGSNGTLTKGSLTVAAGDAVIYVGGKWTMWSDNNQDLSAT